MYRLDQIVQKPGNRVLFYFQDGPDRAFVREELMHIPEGTQVMSTWMNGWVNGINHASFLYPFGRLQKILPSPGP